VPEPERSTPTQLRGPLARLDRAREELAKAWLVRLIQRASLDQIRDLPTDRIAAELPDLISDVLHAAAEGGEVVELGGPALERAARLAELRAGPEPSAGDLARDVAAIQGVLIESLRDDANELGADGFARLVSGLSEAVAAVQATAIETLVARRSRELESLAHTDPLTGLSNLRLLQQQMRHALGLAKRYEQPFALLVLDIDGLRRINDSEGRVAGDRILVQVALAVRRTIRTVDTPARIGGDEFCVLAPNQRAETASALAERLVEAVAAETTPAGDETAVGVSVGVVSCPEHGNEADALLESADQAMYKAKAGGEAFAVGDVEPEIKVERTKK
jgi:diguanylate cyclase (GGDEF)-like protein